MKKNKNRYTIDYYIDLGTGNQNVLGYDVKNKKIIRHSVFLMNLVSVLSTLTKDGMEEKEALIKLSCLLTKIDNLKEVLESYCKEIYVSDEFLDLVDHDEVSQKLIEKIDIQKTEKNLSIVSFHERSKLQEDKKTEIKREGIEEEAENDGDNSPTFSLEDILFNYSDKKNSAYLLLRMLLSDPKEEDVTDVVESVENSEKEDDDSKESKEEVKLNCETIEEKLIKGDIINVEIEIYA